MDRGGAAPLQSVRGQRARRRGRGPCRGVCPSVHAERVVSPACASSPTRSRRPSDEGTSVTPAAKRTVAILPAATAAGVLVPPSRLARLASESRRPPRSGAGSVRRPPAVSNPPIVALAIMTRGGVGGRPSGLGAPARDLARRRDGDVLHYATGSNGRELLLQAPRPGRAAIVSGNRSTASTRTSRRTDTPSLVWRRGPGTSRCYRARPALHKPPSMPAERAFGTLHGVGPDGTGLEQRAESGGRLVHLQRGRYRSAETRSKSTANMLIRRCCPTRSVRALMIDIPSARRRRHPLLLVDLCTRAKPCAAGPSGGWRLRWAVGLLVLTRADGGMTPFPPSTTSRAALHRCGGRVSPTTSTPTIRQRHLAVRGGAERDGASNAAQQPRGIGATSTRSARPTPRAPNVRHYHRPRLLARRRGRIAMGLLDGGPDAMVWVLDRCPQGNATCLHLPSARGTDPRVACPYAAIPRVQPVVPATARIGVFPPPRRADRWTRIQIGNSHLLAGPEAADGHSRGHHAAVNAKWELGRRLVPGGREGPGPRRWSRPPSTKGLARGLPGRTLARLRDHPCGGARERCTCSP
jgi:hypothetical protein